MPLRNHITEPFKLPSRGLGVFLDKAYIPVAIFLLLLWIPAIYGNNRVKVYYKLDNSLPDNLQSVQANKELEDNYDMSGINDSLLTANSRQRIVNAV